MIASMPSLARTRILGLLLLLGAFNGCTTWRIIRYREPDARNQGMFPSRPVRQADEPSVFPRAAVMRNDIDTLSVRAAGQQLMSFRQYLADHRVLAFVIVRNDTIVYEHYRDGFTETTIHNSFSMAKSVLSALIGIALGEGSIRSLDDPITEYLPELRGRPAFDGVTVRHLLDMKSGLRFTETGNGLWSDFRSDEARIYYTTNLEKTLAGATRVAMPGTTWDYKDTDAELLGWVLSRAVGMTVAAYTEEKLWRRIGTEHAATWSLDHANGREKVSSGFNATARDFARFGSLFLNGGVWDGSQVVPASWVRQSVAVDSSRTEPEIATWWKMQHTLYWWHPIQPPAGEFYADGSRGQRIFVDPATRTVIVQLANYSPQDFPFRRIAAYLSGQEWQYPRSIPALVRQAAITQGADSVRTVFARLVSEQRASPARYVLTRTGLLTAGRLVAADAATRPAGIEVLRLVTELYPTFAPGFVELSDALVAAGDNGGALVAIRRAATLAPADADVARRLRTLGGG